MTTFTWLGISNSFSTTTNWSPNGSPGNGDTIIIANSALIKNQPSLGAADFENTTFILGSGLGRPADLTTGDFTLDTGSLIITNPGGVNFLGPSSTTFTFATGSPSFGLCSTKLLRTGRYGEGGQKVELAQA